MDLQINPRLVIPSKELQWRFSRSQGPGGQGVNTRDSRVALIFDLNNSSVFNAFLKQRLITQLQSRCINGCLIVIAAEERTQYLNRRLALTRMGTLLREGLKAPSQERKPTKTTRASEKCRLKTKKLRGALKKQRQSKPSMND